MKSATQQQRIKNIPHGSHLEKDIEDGKKSLRSECILA